MMSFPFVFLEDTYQTSARLGKLRASLPQEYELAAFIQEIENPHVSWSVHIPACSWMNVKCSDSGYVTDLYWDSRNAYAMRGVLHWKNLPPTLSRLYLMGHQLSGNLHLEHLPHKPLSLKACINQFTGNLSMDTLPELLIELSVSDNQLEGSLDLTHLPTILHILRLNSNRFTGNLVLIDLPSSLSHLFLYLVGTFSLVNPFFPRQRAYSYCIFMPVAGRH